MPSPTSLLTTLLLTIPLSSSHPISSTYSINLLYPRPNSTISSFHPIPVVFAIQPPSLPINLLNGQIQWTLYPVGSEGSLTAPGAEGGQISIDRALNWSTSPSPSQLSTSTSQQEQQQQQQQQQQPSSYSFKIDSLSSIVGIDDHWVFIWSVKARNYTGPGYKNDNSENGVVRTDKLFFRTERGATEPDLVAATAEDACNTAQTAVFGIEGYQNDTLQTPWNVVAVLGNDTTETMASPCEVKINASRAESIAAEITAKYCAAKGYNLTRLNVSCDGYYNPRSGASRGLEAGWGMLTGSMLAVVMGVVVML